MSAHAVLCSLSRRERDGVRALHLSTMRYPPHPPPSPHSASKTRVNALMFGERESDRG
jgi:hypothetical protein